MMFTTVVKTKELMYSTMHGNVSDADDQKQQKPKLVSQSLW